MTRRVAHHGRTESYAEAPPEAVFDIVSDVTRVGEWSHECRGAHWVGPEQAAAPGVRFRGTNKSGIYLWSRSCVFTTVERPHLLSWKTTGLMGKIDSTEWRITLEPEAGGTRIVQAYDVLHVAPGFDRIYWLLIKGHRDRRAALAEDLDRLAALAAARPRKPLPTHDA
ncbi:MULTISPECIES: SRPBCC family protein [Gordonia]|uniref:Polyketide cyclase n=1 Tax=Gordonia alkanivorans CGMCC 6845 TaxID=1423140 RepID=W9DKD1_9ACTN|nr:MULTISPECIES: SRPBCC family protein [Gordonia]ETA07291.1 polyketide cyclase [Gordonia alkanivorans CGMCC 6845]MDH3007808.1 SRPBCC family protein [Gordonia alkanivorans]MDH3010673.1 SRPBCC family protein [Gordonia alkanivorans]MDH3015390.1 SRPBCC family protein [Gordonia alkanivorans]MDH3020123.1 SRPBCC family protein [Gordonia alkanivorans]